MRTHWNWGATSSWHHGHGWATGTTVADSTTATATVQPVTETTVTADTTAPAATTITPAVAPPTGLSAADTALIDKAAFFVAPGGSDNAAGTQNAPLATIDAAIDKAQPGDVILVRGGTYTDQVNVWKGGTADAPLTIQAYPGEHPVIDGHGTAANTDLVSITAPNVVFEGFEVQNATKAGISVWNAANVSVLDNIVHDTQQAGIYVGGDHLGSAANETISGNTVYHAVLENEARSAGSGWAQAIGLDTATDSVVSNNTSFDNYGEGFGALSSTHVTFSGNTAYDNFSVQMYFDNSQYIEATGNTLFQTGDSGYYRDGAPGAGLLIANEYTTFQLPTLGDNIHDNTLMGVTGPYYDSSYGWGGGLGDSILGAETILPASAVTADMLWHGDQVA